MSDTTTRRAARQAPTDPEAWARWYRQQERLGRVVCSLCAGIQVGLRLTGGKADLTMCPSCAGLSPERRLALLAYAGHPGARLRSTVRTLHLPGVGDVVGRTGEPWWTSPAAWCLEDWARGLSSWGQWVIVKSAHAGAELALACPGCRGSGDDDGLLCMDCDGSASRPVTVFGGAQVSDTVADVLEDVAQWLLCPCSSCAEATDDTGGIPEPWATVAGLVAYADMPGHIPGRYCKVIRELGSMTSPSAVRSAISSSLTSWALSSLGAQP